jgi:putative redox protein
MVTVTARRREGYAHEVEIEGGHSILVDEPAASGGADEGPAPTRVLAAALASCTAITVEMYAARKGWEVGALEVRVEMDYEGPVPSAFTVTLRIPTELTSEQRERLREIAGRCPVHRALSNETHVAIRDLIATPTHSG